MGWGHVSGHILQSGLALYSEIVGILEHKPVICFEGSEAGQGAAIRPKPEGEDDFLKERSEVGEGREGYGEGG